MGFSSYFLITWDLIRHARENGIRVGPGRGSAAGCCVAYLLRITDPIHPVRPAVRALPQPLPVGDARHRHGLRLPIRDEMIRYASQRYGRDHVAQIITFSTIKALAAVRRRSSARLRLRPRRPHRQGHAALVMGRDTPLWACLEKSEAHEDGFRRAGDLRRMYESDDDAKKVIDVATGLENLRRQDSIHAAAVVITDQPLTEYLPVQRKPEAGQDVDAAPVVTQYEMHGVEELGLLKMDFLGLRNLDVIHDVARHREDLRDRRRHRRHPLDDDRPLAMLREASPLGVFQLEAADAVAHAVAGPHHLRRRRRAGRPLPAGPMAAGMHHDYAERKNGRSRSAIRTMTSRRSWPTPTG